MMEIPNDARSAPRKPGPFASTRFRSWLRCQYYEGTGEAIRLFLDLREARAQFDGLQRAVHMRTAAHEGRSGAIRAYAVTAGARTPLAPDIPTADEAGVPRRHVSIWNGFWVPRATPKETIARLNAAAADAMADAGVRNRLGALGCEIPTREQQSPEALGSFQRAEIEKWWPIIKAAGISAE